jgi:hypothetical protein
MKLWAGVIRRMQCMHTQGEVRSGVCAVVATVGKVFGARECSRQDEHAFMLCRLGLTRVTCTTSCTELVQEHGAWLFGFLHACMNVRSVHCMSDYIMCIILAFFWTSSFWCGEMDHVVQYASACINVCSHMARGAGKRCMHMLKVTSCGFTFGIYPGVVCIHLGAAQCMVPCRSRVLCQPGTN